MIPSSQSTVRLFWERTDNPVRTYTQSSYFGFTVSTWRTRTCVLQGLPLQLSSICRSSIDSITHAIWVCLPITSPDPQDQDNAIQLYCLLFGMLHYTSDCLKKTTDYYSGSI